MVVGDRRWRRPRQRSRLRPLNGNITAYRGAETHGLVGTPIYASGNGWPSWAGGMYQLDATSPGYGTAARLANFNDAYAAPDIGAHQSGTAAMCFGVSCPGAQ